MYSAKVVVTTNDRSWPFSEIPVKLHVFCGRLYSNLNNSEPASFTNIDIHPFRQGERETHMLTGILRFNRPLLSINRKAATLSKEVISIKGKEVFVCNDSCEHTH